MELTITTTDMVLTLVSDDQPALTLTTAAETVLELSMVGLPGPPGGPGVPGVGVQDDPGDFTLIFENQLI